MEATSTYIVLMELAGNVPPHLNAIQLMLAPHVDFLITFWKSVWVVTGLYVIYVYVREWRRRGL